MPALDISRETTNVIFDKELSGEIISKAVEDSAFMQLASRMPIAGNGKKFQTITGDPVPEWVGETTVKPMGTFAFGKKEVMPYKMALIVPFSDEFRRDKAALYNECVGRLPKLFGRVFDSTVMGTTPPGDGFDTLGGSTKASILPTTGVSTYDRFIAVDATIGAANGVMNGIALSPQGRSILLGEVDGIGHPLFTPGVGSGTVGNILGADVQVKKGVYVAGTAPTEASGTEGQEGYVPATEGTPAIVGIAGDWDNAAWGAVDSIQGSISNEASITVGTGQDAETLNLWQRNMFAVRFEVELAFMVRYPETFVLLTGNTPAAA